MIKNGVEILEFTPEETRKEYEKKAERKELKMKHHSKSISFKNYNNNNNYIKPYRGKKNQFHGNYYVRGRDNFSKRNIHEREIFYDEFEFDEYKDFPNNRRNNIFYERGRPNPVFRNFRGRRGGY